MEKLSKIIGRVHRWFNRKMFTGKCVCGHTSDAHHGNMVMNRRCTSPKDMWSVLYGECEIGEINGEPTGETPCHCNFYLDKGWLLLRIKEWFRHVKIGVNTHNYLKGDVNQINSNPYASIFWNGGSLALIISLWFIEFQLWIGNYEEGVIDTIYDGTA